MQIELRRGKGRQPWHWNVRNGGRITTVGEHHGSINDALRAAKGVANAFYRIALKAGALDRMPQFSKPVWRDRSGSWVVKVVFVDAGIAR